MSVRKNVALLPLRKQSCCDLVSHPGSTPPVSTGHHSNLGAVRMTRIQHLFFSFSLLADLIAQTANTTQTRAASRSHMQPLKHLLDRPDVWDQPTTFVWRAESHKPDLFSSLYDDGLISRTVYLRTSFLESGGSGGRTICCRFMLTPRLRNAAEEINE